MKITINVTQRDIDSKSTGKSICATCPVARAVRRIKRFKNARVGTSDIFSLTGHTVAKLPAKVQRWIYNYGHSTANRNTAKPFKFTVEVKDENA